MKNHLKKSQNHSYLAIKQSSWTSFRTVNILTCSQLNYLFFYPLTLYSAADLFSALYLSLQTSLSWLNTHHLFTHTLLNFSVPASDPASWTAPVCLHTLLFSCSATCFFLRLIKDLKSSLLLKLSLTFPLYIYYPEQLWYSLPRFWTPLCIWPWMWFQNWVYCDWGTHYILLFHCIYYMFFWRLLCL